MEENRDIEAEKRALKSYQQIYKKNPSTSDDWAKLNKIAYPGQEVEESLASTGRGTLSQTVEGSGLEQLGSRVDSAAAEVDKTSQPNEALRVLQEAIRAKSGVMEQPLGISQPFKEAGLTGMASLDTALSSQTQKFGDDYVKFSNTIGQMAGTYKDMASAALGKYDRAYGEYKDEVNRLQKVQDDLNSHSHAIAAMEQQYQNSIRLDKYRRDNPDLATVISASDSGYEQNASGEWVPVAPTISLETMSNKPIDSTPKWMYGFVNDAALRTGVPAALISAVIKNESGFNHKAANDKTSREKSYGLGQINLLAHPQITRAQAEDPVFAIDFVADRLKGMIDKYGVYEGVQAYNTPGAIGSQQLIKYADKILGDSGVDKREMSIATGKLDPIIELQIQKLVTDVTKGRGTTEYKEQQHQNARALFLQGYDMDAIEDELRYSSQSGLMTGIWRDATTAAAGPNMTGEKLANFMDEVDRNLEEGNVKQARANIRKGVINQLSVDESKRFTGKERTVQFLNEIDDDLKRYESMGGKTNIFTGTKEQIFGKIGKVKDSEARAVATKIATALQQYRLTMTGVQFSVQENAEYKAMFPSISSTKNLNTANLNALKDTFTGDVEFTYRRILGDQPFEEVMKNDLYGRIGQDTKQGGSVIISGIEYSVGEVITNAQGIKGRIEADGTVTRL